MYISSPQHERNRMRASTNTHTCAELSTAARTGSSDKDTCLARGASTRGDRTGFFDRPHVQQGHTTHHKKHTKKTNACHTRLAQIFPNLLRLSSRDFHQELSAHLDRFWAHLPKQVVIKPQRQERISETRLLRTTPLGCVTMSRVSAASPMSSLSDSPRSSQCCPIRLQGARLRRQNSFQVSATSRFKDSATC